MVQIVYICECERTEIQREKNEKWKKMMYKNVRSKVLELRVWSTWVGSMKYEKLQDEVQELMGVSTRINGMKNSRHAIS